MFTIVKQHRQIDAQDRVIADLRARLIVLERLPPVTPR